MAGIKGMKHRRPRTPKDRDAYAAARIEQMLDEAREGSVKLDASQLKAMEIRYSRLRPILSAIEQTVTDPRDKQDPAELALRLAAMFEQKPELFDQVMRIRSAASTQQTLASPASPALAQVTH